MSGRIWDRRWAQRHCDSVVRENKVIGWATTGPQWGPGLVDACRGNLFPGDVKNAIMVYILTRNSEFLLLFSIACERRSSGFLLAFPPFGLVFLLICRFRVVLLVRRSFRSVVVFPTHYGPSRPNPLSKVPYEVLLCRFVFGPSFSFRGLVWLIGGRFRAFLSFVRRGLFLRYERNFGISITASRVIRWAPPMSNLIISYSFCRNFESSSA